MPIYAYRCEACGFAKDVLQKMSDAALTDCPECGKSEFKKQLTAAGFQLKGTGWYVTDFRGNSGTSGTSAPAVASTDSTTTSGTTSTTSTTSTPAAGASDNKPAAA